MTWRPERSHWDAIPASVWSILNRASESGSAWVNFRSSPGWGNTTFLQNLKIRAESDARFRDSLVVLCGSQRDQEGQWVSELGPIGNALYPLDPKNTVHGIARLISRFRNLQARDRWKLVGKQFLVVGAAAILSEFGYVLQGEKSWVWIVVAVLLMYVGAHAFTSKDLPDPELQKLDPNRLSDFIEPKALVRRLEEIRGKARRIILLIDDLDHLPTVEFVFLKHLIERKNPLNEVCDLRGHAELLIVSVDPTRGVKVPGEVGCPDLPEPHRKLLDDVAGYKEAERKKAEAKAKAVLAVCGTGRHGSWGLLELLALCVTDTENARTEKDWASILADQDGTPLARHLNAIGSHIEHAPPALISTLAKTPLYRRNGMSLYRDRLVAAALRTTFEDQYRGEILQAHFFWYAYLASQTRAAGDRRLYESAIAAAKSPADALGVFGLEGLLGHLAEGAQFWRVAGDVELCSDALKAGRDLLAAASPPAEVTDQVLGDFAAEWAMLYSLAGLPAEDCTSGETPAGLIERLRAHPVWSVHRTQIEELVHAGLPQKIDDHGMRQEIQNLNRSMYAAGRVRRLGGNDGYSHPELDAGDPVDSPRPDLGEFDLYRCHARRARATEGVSSFKSVMNRFKARLMQTRPKESELGLEAVWLFGRAIHMDALQGWWVDEMEALGASPETNPRYRELCDVVWDLSLEPVGDPATALAAQTKVALERSLTLANLCSLTVVSISIVAHLTSLFLESPASFQTSDSEWWLAWDHVFEVALQQCRELGLVTFEAYIRWARFGFFQKLDVRSSAVDALRFYEVASLCHYPAKTLGAWNDKVRDLLTGYTIPPQLHLSLAKVWMDWVDLVRESDPFENQSEEVIEAEQASSLVFAAQSFRLGRDLSRAFESLTRAAELLDKRYGHSRTLRTSESRPERSTLYIFYTQCQQLHKAGAGGDLPNASKHELWQMLRPGDFNLTGALIHLIAERKGLMSTAWDSGEIFDPINHTLTLVSAEQNKVVPPATYFEFHVRLILGWLTGDSYTALDNVGELARKNWDNYEFPDRVIVPLAEIGLPIKDIPELDRVMVALLREVHYDSANVHPSDQVERSSLELLMKYQPHQTYWRGLYKNVCQELVDLIRREEEQMRGRGELDYVQLAVMIQEYLEPLENPEIRLAYYASVEEAVRERLSVANEAARTLAAGETMACWDLLKEHLDWPDGIPATILQLHMLNMARQCATKEPELAERVTPLTQELEKLLVAFARRFVKSISTADEKELAKRIEERVLSLFQKASRATA